MNLLTAPNEAGGQEARKNYDDLLGPRIPLAGYEPFAVASLQDMRRTGEKPAISNQI